MGYLEEVSITHAPGGPGPRAHVDTEMHFLGVVVKESPKVIAQTNRKCVYATLCFTKREKAAADNNLMSRKLLRRYRSRDIFHGSEEVPFQMHYVEMKKELKAWNEDGHVQRCCD